MNTHRSIAYSGNLIRSGGDRFDWVSLAQSFHCIIEPSHDNVMRSVTNRLTFAEFLYHNILRLAPRGKNLLGIWGQVVDGDYHFDHRNFWRDFEQEGDMV